MPDFSLDEDSFSITEAAFAEISRAVRESYGARPSVLEFGSGVSTVRWALEFPEGSLISIEHMAEYAERTRTLLEDADMVKCVDLRLVSVHSRLVGGAIAETYSDLGGLVPALDAVIVDGPPGALERGRAGTLWLVRAHLNQNATVFLDDLRRPGERAALDEWRSAFPEASIEELDVGHGVAVFKLG